MHVKVMPSNTIYSLVVAISNETFLLRELQVSLNGTLDVFRTLETGLFAILSHFWLLALRKGILLSIPAAFLLRLSVCDLDIKLSLDILAFLCSGAAVGQYDDNE